jgi:hypothetical protein
MRYVNALWKATLAVCVLIGPCYRSQGQESRPSQQQVETVSLCQLTKDWKKYDHRTVRIEAIYATGAESYEVYDTGCLIRSDNTAWVEFPAEVQKATPPEIMERMNGLLRLNGRARVVAVGEFDGPKKVNIPPNTPPGVAKLMRATNSRYGHMNHWRFQFVFEEIEKVEAVPLTDPWPHWASKKKQ